MEVEFELPTRDVPTEDDLDDGDIENLGECNDSEVHSEVQGMLVEVDRSTAEHRYEQYTICALHEPRDNQSATALYQMLKVSDAPIDSRDRHLDVKCFPDLYPTGVNGQWQERTVHLKAADFIKTRLKSKHSQFRLNQQYLFFLLNDSNMRQLSAGIFHKLNVSRPNERLSAAACLEKMAKDELEGNLTTIFARLRNTEQFWKRPRNDLRCMSYNYGPATWFMTLSPSEWDWTDLESYLRLVNGPSAARKPVNELVAMDPVSTSRFIDNKFRAMLDFITSDTAPIGKVTHYFWRREYQGRGTQHFHMLIWVENTPILGQSSKDEVATFITQYLSCAKPNPASCPLLYQRVTRYQRHKHNSYCMRSKKTKTGFQRVCRFSFPRAVANNLELRDIQISIAGRKTLKNNSRLYDLPRKENEVDINDYNSTVLLAWPGNMDIQFVGEKTALLNWYITKYVSKCEKGYAQQTFDELNSTKSLCSRLYNIGLRSMNHRECGALEASDTLLGLSLHGTDPHTTIRWLDVGMVRGRRLKSRKEVLQLDAESTDIFYASWVDGYYPDRPKELETTHLIDFFRWYDIIKVKPTGDVEWFELPSGKYLKRRSRAHLVNHFRLNVKQEPEKYFYALLLMFKHWRDTDELKGDFVTFAQAFHANKEELLEAVKYHEHLTAIEEAAKHAKELIEAKVTELEAEDAEDDAPDNPLAFEPVEAQGAMREFRDAAVNEEPQVVDLEAMVANLNADQRRVFNHVTSTVKDDCPSAGVLRHYTSGVGGSGKSFLIRTIKCWVKANLGLDVAVMAPTGIAAFNVNGMTIYRLLQLPVEHGHTPNYTQLSDQVLKVIRSELKNVALFVIDEISMVSNLTLMYIHLRLSEIFNTKDAENGWFGRKHLLLFGDLLQLPPVHEASPFVKLTSAQATKYLGALSVVNLWTELFSYDELTINMRQQNDLLFADMLSKIRLGVVTVEDCKTLEGRLVTFNTDTTDGKLRELISYINTLSADTVCLLATRHMCGELNDAMLAAIDSEEIRLVAKDTFDCAPYLHKKVNNLIKNYEDDSSRTAGLEKVIVIKIGAKIMLRRNIDVTLGLVNGAIGVVVSVQRDTDTNDVASVTIDFSSGNGNYFRQELKPITTKFEVMDRAFVHREQFPITISYGITIHKSQGLSLNSAVMDIGSSVFTCGQAYVALSRVTRLNGLHLINFNPAMVKAQESAIIEYNRLRQKFRPDLSTLVSMKPIASHRKRDRAWTTHAQATRVQASVSDTAAPTRADTIYLRGFRNNDGVSCYANATLLSLLQGVSLRNRLLADVRHNALHSLAHAYVNGRDVMDSNPVRSMVGGVFTRSEQQDASEFLLALVHKVPALEQELEYRQVYKSMCRRCGWTGETCGSNEIILQIHVPQTPVGRYLTLQDMFDAAFAPETLNDWFCEQCRGLATRQMSITSASDLLVLQFKLWNLEGNKNTTLKLSGVPKASIQAAGNTYEPLAAIFHHGNQTIEGHYTSYIKVGASWMVANDSVLKKSTWPKLAKDIFLLLLSKKQPIRVCK